jgi:nitroreductase
MAKQVRRNFLKTGLMLGTGIVISSIPGIANEKDMTNTEELSVFDVIHKRRSVRSYTSTPVPEEHITKILDAARMAPTSGNQQPWKFLVVQDRTKIDELMSVCIANSVKAYKARQNASAEELRKYEVKIKAYLQNIFVAPVFIVVLVDMQSKWPSYNKFDGPLAAGYLMLAARALGYGTVFFTDTIPDQVTKEVLSIPDRYQRICITPVGIPKEWPATPAKKKLDELVVYESF